MHHNSVVFLQTVILPYVRVYYIVSYLHNPLSDYNNLINSIMTFLACVLNWKLSNNFVKLHSYLLCNHTFFVCLKL